MAIYFAHEYVTLGALGWVYKRAAPTKHRLRGWYKQGIRARNYKEAYAIQFNIGFRRFAAREPYAHFYD